MPIKKICLYLLVTVFIFHTSYFAQTKSLIQQVNKLPENLKREFIVEHIKELYKQDSVKARIEINEALKFYSKKGLLYATILSCQANYFYKTKQFYKSLNLELKALEAFDNINDFEHGINSLSQIIRSYRSLNRINEAIELLFKRLKLAEGFVEKECILLEKIGSAFKEIKNEEKGLIYLREAEEKSLRISNYSSRVLNESIFNIEKNLGVIYRNRKDFEKAIYHLNKAFAFAESIDNKEAKGAVLNSLGVLFQQKKEYMKAIGAYEESLKFKSNDASISTTFSNLGDLYMIIGNYAKAESYLNKSYILANKVNDKRRLLNVCMVFFQLYDKTNKPLKALPFLKRGFALKDSLYDESTAEESAKLEALYNNDKKQREIEISKIKNQQLEKNIESKNRERNILLIGSLILIVLLFWAVRSFVGKKKSNALLEEKNKLINQQKALVELKQKEVLDSIHYAKRIQNALLTSEIYIERELNKLQDKKH
jgi:tetratricopeptide (TPR) repeat protein